MSLTLFLVTLPVKANETDLSLKVGVVLYLSNSDYSHVAKEFRRGLELAQYDYPNKIQLHFEDDEGRNNKTVSATQKLINIDKVDLLLYSEYVQVQAAGPVAQRAKVPALVLWESGPEIENIGDHIFGVGLWTPSGGAVPARFAKNRLNATTASLIYDVSSWSDTIARYFKEEFIRLGGKIVLEETLPKGSTDFRASLTKVKRESADILFAPVSEHPVAFFKQLRKVRYDKPVLASDQISQEFVNAGDGALEKLYFSNAPALERDSMEILDSKYRNFFNSAPGNLFFVALAYDALRFAIEAWLQQGGGPLRDTLANFEGQTGTLAKIRLNANGSFPRQEIMYRRIQ